jgi:hypothetical protein
MLWVMDSYKKRWVMAKKLFTAVLFIVMPTLLMAHSGGLDRDGGHNCYIGPCAGTYHYHGGNASGFNFGWLFLAILVGIGCYYFWSNANGSHDEDNHHGQGSVSEVTAKDAMPNFNDREAKTSSKPSPNLTIGKVNETAEADQELSSDQSGEFNDYKSWLVRKVEINELENGDYSLNIVDHEWTKLKSIMVVGDEIWEYDSPADYWDSMCGEAGLALVRNGHVVFVIVTEQN